ncbi:MAG: hypothetical protein C0467_09145 [Planctomycetaceae bacterium]|nr:hypothetical protein [Planctomycetaceae bacterium]
MIRQIAILLGAPLIVAVAIATPLAQWHGPYHWLCAAVALGLTVPVGITTLVIAERSAKASAFVQVAVLFSGTFVRVLIGFGGAVVVFFAAGETFRAQPLVFFGWVLGAYLTTLAVEVALIGSKMMRRESGGQ